jgi:glycosyltransferase involved in cell wall biosynthesis
MSLKRYGIFVAYPPTVDLRHEGLGRYLASFLKGAAARDDVRFVLACPSWANADLERLFSSEGVPPDVVELVHPQAKPLLLRIYEAYRRYRMRRAKTGIAARLAIRGGQVLLAWGDRNLRRLSQVRSLLGLLPVLTEAAMLALLLVVLSPLVVLGGLAWMLRRGLQHSGSLRTLPLVRQVAMWLQARLEGPRVDARVLRAVLRFQSLLGDPRDDGFVLRMYAHMEEAEIERMLGLINGLSDVRAWYCPTAFWPAFNRIRSPRLMCVPDVVLADFPAAFSTMGGDRTLRSFETLEAALHGGDRFVTYSDEVKWSTLVRRYSVHQERVAVIPHAPNDLSRWVRLSNLPDPAAAERKHCEALMASALRKATHGDYAMGFANPSFKFLFYASQFRPNKNVISLLRAYEFLLRKRFLSHKLVLTGNPRAWKPVQDFILEHSLERDVLCLHGLSIQELAACYHLADLAVNPSLSEGGCPFTFTEALSVDTPAVMARIPVALEVLTDPELRQCMFFDPYDWRDMAERIQWAVAHRGELLVMQRKTYADLARRTWTDVVGEHLNVLEQIASSQSAESAAHRS